jgi:MFS family permease
MSATTDIRTGAGAPRTVTTSSRHNAAFWIVGYTFAVTMAFSAVPAPLYVLYQARDHFSTFMITVIFAAYAAGVVASLFLAGHLSDWVGRRRMMLIAVAISIASGVLFLVWPATAGLIVARVISGVSIGMLTATATAYLSELHATARPDAGRTRSEIVATAANLGGIGLGPLLAGLLAQYAGHALVLPYLVSEALMLAGAIALTVAPETASILRTEQRPAYRPQRVSVPDADRPLFFAVAAAGGAVFALFGLFTSVTPSLLADLLHNDSHAVAGVVAFAVFGAAALAQIVFGRASRRYQVGIGLAAVLAGLALVTASVWVPSFWLLLVGGIVAGGGAGAAFRGLVATVISITPAEVRGEGLAGLFLGSYVGLAVPVVGVGVATLWVSMPVAVLGLAAVLAAVLFAVARRILA